MDVFDDDPKDDPKYVDTLLSSELLRLSLKDRNDIQEEIHGVHCLAPEETPELLEQTLRNLDLELEKLPPDETKAYQRSQRIPNTYVNTLEFRLRFLRCELLDAKKAAKRMMFFLNTALEFFGESALERPIRLSDFKKEELKYMRKGRIQMLPFRDRSGRRAVVIFPRENNDKQETVSKVMLKLAMYFSWTVGNNVENQRKGVVVIVWYDRSFFLPIRPVVNKYKLHEMLTVRCCALHCCTPDSPVYRFRRAVMTMKVSHLRMKLRIHVGNTVELSYILNGYGLRTDTIPITFSGTLKTPSMRQWMRLQAFLEEPFYQNTEETKSIIECPYNNDIVIRQGTSILAHPGNATFRALIAIKFDEIERIHNSSSDTTATTATSRKSQCHGNSNSYKKKPQKTKDNNKLTTRVIVKQVMDEMLKTKRRVLNWNDALGCWKVLTDESQIYVKVEYLVREHRITVAARANRQWNQSSTSIFCNSSGNSSGNSSSNKTTICCGSDGDSDSDKMKDNYRLR